MKTFMEEYGKVIVVAIIVVALITVALLFKTSGMESIKGVWKNFMTKSQLGLEINDGTSSEESEESITVRLYIGTWNVDHAQYIRIYDGTDTSGNLLYEKTSDFTDEDYKYITDLKPETGKLFITAGSDAFTWIRIPESLQTAIDVSDLNYPGEISPYERLRDVINSGDLYLEIDFDY